MNESDNTAPEGTIAEYESLCYRQQLIETVLYLAFILLSSHGWMALSGCLAIMACGMAIHNRRNMEWSEVLWADDDRLSDEDHHAWLWRTIPRDVALGGAVLLVAVLRWGF